MEANKLLLLAVGLGVLYLAALPMHDGKGTRLLALVHAISTGNSQAILPAVKGKKA